MQFESGHIYHIYNQGNNQRKVFFDRENYLFFLSKLRTHILPYGDIFAWCLMPNHFHLMVLVNDVIGGATQSRASNDIIRASNDVKTIDLNHSIGIMIASYTRAINKQRNMSGSLFRSRTKAECIDCINKLTPSFIGNEIIISNPQKQYPQVCFDYIHQNPVKAKLVKKAEDWEYSSAIDFAGIRDGNLINRNVARQYLDFK